MNPAALDFLLAMIKEADQSGDRGQVLSLLGRLLDTIGDDRGVIAMQVRKLDDDDPGLNHDALRGWAMETRAARLLALHRGAETRSKGLVDENTRKAVTVAQRLRLGRRLIREDMTGEGLRRAYAERGLFVAKRTAERDLIRLREGG